ncbi:MAG: hypothetical protein EU549_00780 [Promethearchaeota archaeon]|nr:MAG: hypothetical protein EU549_00780 [Candidatus Lokiarchaeota archaeon]
MLEVEEVDKNRKLRFYLVDSHHHIGEDEDGHRNLTVDGSFGFFRTIWKLLNEKYEKLDTFPYYFKPKFLIKRIVPPKPLNFLNSNSIHQNSWIFDQFIAFPFQDTFRAKAKMGEKIIKYHNSNTRLAKITSGENTGCRLIGYCRIDPRDEDLALQEIDYSILELGLKGIKLHPLSDDWNSEEYFDPNIESNYLPKIILRAMKYKVPVIFDCRFVNTLKWIYKLVYEIQERFLANNREQSWINDHLKVIVAHIGFLWQNDDFLFKALSNPCIYGDLTGQFSSKTKDLIENLYKKVKCPYSNVSDLEKKFYWSTKIVMGSDYNYFKAYHIVDQLLYFFSEDFYNLIDGNILLLKNIFSENILRLIPNAIHRNSKNIETDDNKILRTLTLKWNQFDQLMANVLHFLRENFDQYPYFFRMFPDIPFFKEYFNADSLYSQNFSQQKDDLESQYNFYFEWRNNPTIIAGIIPPQLERVFIYLLNRKDHNKIPFNSIENISPIFNLNSGTENLNENQLNLVYNVIRNFNEEDDNGAI